MVRIPAGETAAERAKRLDRLFGLTPEQLNLASRWPGDTVAFLISLAEADGIAFRSPGRAICTLRDQGFVEIGKPNGREAVARLTRDGWAAVVLRLRVIISGPPSLRVSRLGYVGRLLLGTCRSCLILATGGLAEGTSAPCG